MGSVKTDEESAYTYRVKQNTECSTQDSTDHKHSDVTQPQQPALSKYCARQCTAAVSANAVWKKKKEIIIIADEARGSEG